jgi:hypothetical protein
MYERYQWIEVEDIEIPGFPWTATLLGTMFAMTIVILVRKRTRENKFDEVNALFFTYPNAERRLSGEERG